MCGLVGILGNPSNRMTNLFLDMLHVDVVRGPDSTGVATVNTENKCWYVKDTEKPWDMMENTAFQELVNPNMRTPNQYLYMGHNRAATRGQVTVENAHPFHHGNIVLAHNGTLTKYHDIVEKPKGVNYWATDSEAVAYSVYKQGIAETWKKLEGAATLSWWDSNDKTLNLITNGKRPLFYTYTKDKKHLIYASEDWMIFNFAGRRGFKIRPNDMQDPDSHLHFAFRPIVTGKRIE